jgi:hypothetical protein
VVFSRPHLSLDGTWEFIEDPDQALAVDGLPAGVPMAVPSCWESQLGPTTPLVAGWLVRTFDLPAEWEPGPTFLRFGAVSYRADVWLNGAHLGGHEGGYTHFELGAGPSIRSVANRLVVRVVNPAGALASYPVLDGETLGSLDPAHPDPSILEIPIGKQTWYSSLSGIWQSVALERRSPAAFGSISVRPDVAAGRVVVAWQRVAPGSSGAATTGIRLTVLAADGSAVAAARVSAPATSGESEIAIPAPRLWDLDDPYLYRVAAELVEADEVVDRVEIRFGMRTIGVADGMVTLNGQPVYVRGVLDQDVHDDGIWVAPSRDERESTFRRIKAMGINVVRCHIKIPEDAYFELADELGLLVWAEVPSWGRLTPASGARARDTLREMVEQLGHHPSLAIWTIVNENWGTDLINDAGHRAWLGETYDWLKELDRTRLVVDNSACWSPDGGNFHVRTDVADYHAYFAMPEHADRWRAAVTEFAARPAWLWSPHGDSLPMGTEPLILSEFGNWGLPRFDSQATGPATTAPWWTETGTGAARPAGVLERFNAQGLGRIASDPDVLVDATQWHQFEAMQHEIGELRRHPAIAGYVVTELSDVFWEANGLLNLDHSDKAYGDWLPDLFGADTIFAELERWDVWSGDVLAANLHARLGAPAGDGHLHVDWLLSGPGIETLSGTVGLASSSDTTASTRLTVSVPSSPAATSAVLSLELVCSDGSRIARQEYRIVIAPTSMKTSSRSQPVTASLEGERIGTWDRVRSLGHVVDPGSGTLITDRLDDAAVAFAERGGSVLALLEPTPDIGFPWVTGPAEPSSQVTSGALARPVSVQSRYGARDPQTGAALNLSGDWISAFSWIDPEVFPALPPRPLLDFAYRDVLPDQVLLGADEAAFAAEVAAGSFVGWIAEPAAYIWSFEQGRGRIIVTTLVLDSDGPVASILLETLVQKASAVREKAPVTSQAS